MEMDKMVKETEWLTIVMKTSSIRSFEQEKKKISCFPVLLTIYPEILFWGRNFKIILNPVLYEYAVTMQSLSFVSAMQLPLLPKSPSKS